MPRRRNRPGGPESASPQESPAAQPGAPGIFRKEGEYWTIAHGSAVFRLKDTKGLAYIFWLLRNPAVEFHVLNLVQDAGGIDPARTPADALPGSPEELEHANLHVGSLGDAGEMLDDRARAAYRRRLTELRDQFEEAKEFNHPERAAQIEREIDALTAELSRAVGLGGRNRRSGSATERARQSVTHAIKDALERIGENLPALRQQLSRAIKTGIYCGYEPDPDAPISWDFGATQGLEAINAGNARVSADAMSGLPVIGSPATQFLSNQPAFVGREAESLQLRNLVDSAAVGQGAIAIIGGGPGVGKTRLATETAAYAEGRGFRAFIGHCYERDEPYPYLAFAEVFETLLAQSGRDAFGETLGDNAAELAQIAPRLRRIFPEIPAPAELPAQQARRYLFQSLGEYLARIAQTAPLLLILDDLQWADESTLALLNFLAHRAAQMPIVIIAVYRDGPADNNPALARTLEELIRIGIRPMSLKGLDREAVGRMLEELGSREPPESLVQLIYAETEGNPFFVEEVFKHLVEEGKVFDQRGDFRGDIEIAEIDVPANLKLVLGRRIDRLGPESQRILTAAAVLGGSFSFKTLQTLLKPADDDDLLGAIEEGQRMGLVVANSRDPEAPFEFAHELIRQTLLAVIPAVRRQRLHLSAADAIETLDQHETGVHAAEIAHHLVAAGPLAGRERVIGYLVRAGRDALASAAYEEAHRHLSGALSRQNGDLRNRAEVLMDLATAERGLGNWDQAFTNWKQAAGLFDGIGDCEATANVFFQMFEGLLWSGRQREAVEVAERGLEGLQDACAGRVHLLAARGLVQSLVGKYEAGREAFAQAHASAGEIGDSKLVATVLAYQAVANFYYLDLQGALASGRQSAVLGKSAGALSSRVIGLSRQQVVLNHMGRNEEAAAVGRELEPLARKLGHFAALSFSIWTQAWTEFGMEPDFARLERHLAEDLEINRKTRSPLLLAPALAQMSVVYFLRGAQPAALDYAEEARKVSPFPVMLGFASGALFRQMAYTGDRAGALALLDQSREKLPRAGAANAIGSWAMLLAAVEGLYILGEHEMAAAFYPLALQLIGTGVICMGWVARFPQTVAGIAAAAARNWEAAEEHFDSALRQAQAFPHQLEVAEIDRFRAAMLIDRAAPGDLDRARTLLTEALGVYTRIGMPRHIELASSMIAALPHA